MKPGEIILNGVSSETLGFRIQARPDIPSPRRKLEFIDAPGMSGSIVYDDMSFEDTPFELALIIKGTGRDNHEEIMNKIWDVYNYFDTGKYVPMIPWFDPLKTYWVIPEDGQGPNFVNNVYMDGHIIASINLKCRPYKYLNGYPAVVHPTTNITLESPTRTHGGAPLIIVEGSGALTVTVNGKQFVLEDIPTNIYIDSESKMCYSVVGNQVISRNYFVKTREYPEFRRGNNTITFTGTNVQTVTIQPRWRTRI